MSEQFNCPQPEHCNLAECQAHRYVMQLIDETRSTVRAQQDTVFRLDKSIAILTANQTELAKLSARWDHIVCKLEDKDKAQDSLIASNTNFTNKALGTIGSISFIAFIASVVTGVLQYLFEKGE